MKANHCSKKIKDLSLSGKSFAFDNNFIVFVVGLNSSALTISAK